MQLIRRYERELIALTLTWLFLWSGRMGITTLMIINGILSLLVAYLLLDPFRLWSVVLIQRERRLFAGVITLDALAVQMPGICLSVRLAAIVGSVLVLLVWLRHRDHWRQDDAFFQTDVVDTTLAHATKEGVWEAGTAWTEYGRAEVAAVIRQGLGQTMTEKKLDRFCRMAFQVGYQDGQIALEDDRDKLQRRIRRLEDEVGKLRDTNLELRSSVSENHEQAEKLKKADSLVQEQRSIIKGLRAEIEELRCRLEPFEAQMEEPKETADRDAEMLALQESGVSYAEIGRRFGISKEAARSAIRRIKAKGKEDSE